MLSEHEIRIILLHEFKLGHNAAEATRNVNQAWGPETAFERTTRRWFEKFRAGDMNIENSKGRGRKPELDNDELRLLIEADPPKTTREIAKELDVDHATISRHLKQLGKTKKLDKWVPHELNENQKKKRFESF